HARSGPHSARSLLRVSTSARTRASPVTRSTGSGCCPVPIATSSAPWCCFGSRGGFIVCGFLPVYALCVIGSASAVGDRSPGSAGCGGEYIVGAGGVGASEPLAAEHGAQRLWDRDRADAASCLWLLDRSGAADAPPYFDAAAVKVEITPAQGA